MSAHLEDFAILRYVAADLAVEERPLVVGHLVACSQCSSLLATISRLDVGLRNLAAHGAMTESDLTLAPNDPFFRRPEIQSVSTASRNSVGVDAVMAAKRGAILAPTVLEAARSPETLEKLFASFDPARGEHRIAVLYALHDAGRNSAEDPFRAMAFARVALGWIRLSARRATDPAQAVAEQMVPRVALRAQAHLLLAIAQLWTCRYSRAGAHLIVAYRGFGAGGGDETKLALVELAEAQRRARSGEPLASFPLVRRARNTFAAFGLDDYVARALVVEGLALDALGRDEEALRVCREALPVFERLGLWSNYVGALNSIATSLSRLGRHAEARREYARALKHFSSDEHHYWQGYVRLGLAEALFADGRFREAAESANRAAKVFDDCRLRAQSLIATLLEIESWARSGDLSRARQRLQLFWAEVERDGRLDRHIVDALNDALSGANPGFERLPALRELAGNQIQERYGASRA